MAFLKMASLKITPGVEHMDWEISKKSISDNKLRLIKNEIIKHFYIAMKSSLYQAFKVCFF